MTSGDSLLTYSIPFLLVIDFNETTFHDDILKFQEFPADEFLAHLKSIILKSVSILFNGFFSDVSDFPLTFPEVSTLLLESLSSFLTLAFLLTSANSVIVFCTAYNSKKKKKFKI